jgi:hypothetical protein
MFAIPFPGMYSTRSELGDYSQKNEWTIATTTVLCDVRLAALRDGQVLTPFTDNAMFVVSSDTRYPKKTTSLHGK